MKKLVILDRDGVINLDSDDYIKSPDEWHAIPGSLQAIADLNRAGFTIVVATNQSGISRRLYDEAALHAIHLKMLTELKQIGGCIEQIFFCPHGPWDDCDCRKPSPGLFEQIQKAYQQPLLNVPAVGDSLRDCQAACKLGCRTFLVRTGKGEQTIDKHLEVLEDLQTEIHDDLRSVVKTICQEY